MTDIPFHKSGSYLRDSWTMKLQLLCPSQNFLYSGKTPVVGQRTETAVVDIAGHECQLSGVVAEVSTVEQWKSSVTNGDRNMREYAAIMMPETTPCLIGYSILTAHPVTDDKTDSPTKSLELRARTVYRVEYTADEALQNVYCVSRLIAVPDHLLQLLPPVVLHFLSENAALWQL